MSRSHFEELEWLPMAPADFRQRCLALGDAASPGREARAIATHALDMGQLETLAEAIAEVRESGADLAPLTRFRLGLLGNGTLDFIEPALIASAARHGVALECIRGGYDQALQDALNPASVINTARPDAVLLALDYRALPLRERPGDLEAAQASVDSTIAHLGFIRSSIKDACGAPVIFQTLVPPAETLFGGFESMAPGTWRALIAETNRRILLENATSNALVLDVAALAAMVGIAEWHSPAQWNMAKLPFDSKFVPIYAEHVGRLVGAILGKSRRCLILDLDNTVWGGIIGDDGLEGIRVAQGDTEGEAHLQLQQLALSLRSRGVVLAVSSKNEDATARLPFRSHPEMILKEEHITVFQANWNDKATNIVAIAKELSLGLDAMVFVDDNPAERSLVRRTLPDVAVPELPEDPAMYARVVGTAGYFDAISFSDEDRRRADFYEGNARRVALQAQVTDMDAYLNSLEMVIKFEPFDAISRARIAQLINKSNQFNLTTRRYTEAEVEALERDDRAFTLQVRLTDAVGDNGMISVIVCKVAGPRTWTIDTWLMSCRVLGRRVESMVLREIIHHAANHGVDRLVGVFRPTERNMMVKDHYATLGFTKTADLEDGATEWTLDLPKEIEAAPMTVIRSGFETVDA